jgi:alanine dehydrogenase
MKQITEAQVKQLLPVKDCIEVLRQAFAQDFINMPRYRIKSQNSLLHVMSASIPALGVMGLKSYGTGRQSTSFAVLLFDERTGSLLAVFEADAMGQIRTGAASGLATDLLARADVHAGAVIGTGYQAETQLLAIDCVRQFQQIRIYSRNAEHRQDFVRRMQEKTRSNLVEAQSAEECVRDADVICAITSARDPVILGKWLKPGCHINAAGVNWHNKREVDAEAVQRSAIIVVDDVQQSKIESGDLIAVGDLDWNRVRELAEVVKGNVRRTSENQITLFKSNGIAMEDVAAAHYVYSNL